MKLIIDIPEEYKEQFIKNKCDDLFNSLATNEFGYVLRKSFETATLETQPCEDAISREAVDEYITNLLSGYLYDEERTRLEDLTAYIWELPPVTPQQKIGHWMNLEKTKYKGQVLPFWGRYGCSKCGGHGEGTFNYCPRCGADMRESEDKE